MNEVGLRLLRILVERFNEGELQTFCFAMKDITYDELPGEGKSNKARELISYYERRNKIHELVNVGKDFRSDIPWDDIINLNRDVQEGLPYHFFRNIREARPLMKADCLSAETIAIMSNRGLSAFGTDQSLISLAEINKYKNLRKIRIILLSPESRWLHSGFVQLRTYESIEAFKKELTACHIIVESGMAKFSKKLGGSKSGVRFHLGEPKFSMVLTEQIAYIKSYGDPPSTQAVDLPIYRFEKKPGSLYSAFKRDFDDLWHNQTIPGEYQKSYLDLETSAGGIVIAEKQTQKYILLLRRHDGYWVIPKGHRLLTDSTLEETAMREVIEETGLNQGDFYIETLLDYYSYEEQWERSNVSKVIHIYLMRCRKGNKPKLQPPEHAEARWWPIHMPLPEMLHTYQRTLLREVIKLESVT